MPCAQRPKCTASRWKICFATRIYHGCTVGTNALVENKVARVGLLATRGHTDTIFHMRAGARLKWMPSHYIAHVAKQTKPAPLVPKHLCAAIDERVTFDGEVLVELNENSARAAIRQLIERGVDALAISLVWSTANPAHEQRLRELVREIAPDLFVSISSEVSARVGEYERTMATIVNSLIGPPMHFYLDALAGDLAANGYRGGFACAHHRVRSGRGADRRGEPGTTSAARRGEQCRDGGYRRHHAGYRHDFSG